MCHLPPAPTPPGIQAIDRFNQRIVNLVRTGFFRTDAEIDAWGAGLIAARQGGPEATAQYLRDNPMFTGTQGVLEAVAGGGAGLGRGVVTPGNLVRTSELIPTHGMTMSRAEFSALTQDIARQGIKFPVHFVELNGRKYIVDGHHRVRAARQLGLELIPAEQVTLPYGGYRTIDDLFSGW